MSRFSEAMSDSETSTKLGVGETLAVVSLTIQLKSVIANIIKALAGKGQKDEERKTIVEALSLGLENIEATVNRIRLPKPHENTIRSYLGLMMKEAKQLEERLYHPKVLQGWDVLTKGSFDYHVTKLRTGLTDINSILGPYPQQVTTVSQYQVGSHPHMPSASTPTPPQVRDSSLVEFINLFILRIFTGPSAQKFVLKHVRCTQKAKQPLRCAEWLSLAIL